jgi:hypothetical protein
MRSIRSCKPEWARAKASAKKRRQNKIKEECWEKTHIY